MPSKLTRIDVGKRAIYNYHVLGNKNNSKTNMQIVDAWYPKTAHQEEIYILNNLLKLANGRDGEYIELNEHTFSLAFMTAGDILQIDESGNFLGFRKNDNAIQQAFYRFEDFSNRKLVTGKPLYLAVTFTGKLELEDQISLSKAQNEYISQNIEDLLKILTGSTELLSDNVNLFITELRKLEELIKEANRPSVNKTLSMTNDITSILSTIVEKTPIAVKLGIDLIKNLTSTI